MFWIMVISQSNRITYGPALPFVIPSCHQLYRLIVRFNQWHVNQCAKGVKFRDAQKLMSDGVLHWFGYVNYSENELLRRVKAREKEPSTWLSPMSPKMSFRFPTSRALSKVHVTAVDPQGLLASQKSDSGNPDPNDLLSPKGSNALKVNLFFFCDRCYT